MFHTIMSSAEAVFPFIWLHVFSHVQLFVNPWTVACQAPLSMGFSGQNTGKGCHFLFQGIFPTQGSNPSLCVSCIGKQILYPCTTWEALTWMHQVLVVALQIFICSMWTPSWGMRDLVPWTGIKPRPSALGLGILSHWTTKEALVFCTLTLCFSFFLM